MGWGLGFGHRDREVNFLPRSSELFGRKVLRYLWGVGTSHGTAGEVGRVRVSAPSQHGPQSRARLALSGEKVKW